MLGADALFARLNAFGLALAESGGYYGASLALGSADVTLLALTNAYRALANGGVYRDVNLNGRAAAGDTRRRCESRSSSPPTSWPTTQPERAPSGSPMRSRLAASRQ
jgi:membrane carboxypeptidase/penicillin-binding protein PbpC